MTTLPTTLAEAKTHGAAQYFTGLPCKHGHVAPRFTCNGTCTMCDVEKRAAKREYYLAYTKEYTATHTEEAKAYRKANRVKIREQEAALAEQHPQRYTWYRRKSMYGLAQADYEVMCAAQQDSCAICKVDFSALLERDIHIDHCHTTDTVRGLLCSRCNHLLGHAKDNTATLQNAIDYLTR